MEKDSPSKPSVAELAGRLKGHILPMPTTNDEKTIVSPNPFKFKMKNSSIIEKLQANLALSPTALLPSPKNPEVKLQPTPSPPTTTPHSPLSPGLRPQGQSSEEEDPVCFESPPEGSTLLSINKTRARLSFKRRPPTRQHRRSAGEEVGAFGSALSPCELNSPVANGDKEPVFNCPAEEDQCGPPGGVEEAGDKDRDCEKTKDKVAKSDPDNRREEEQQGRSSAALEEEQRPSEPCPAEQTEDGNTETEERREEEEEGMSQEECEEGM